MSAAGGAALLLIGICAGIVLGFWARSQFARMEAEAWASQVKALRRRCARLDALRDAQAQDTPRARLGRGAWLIGAVEDAWAEVRPGEVVENLTLHVRWRDLPDQVLIEVDRESPVPVRAVRHAFDGWVYEPIALPEPDHSAWEA